MADNWIVIGEAAKPYDGRYPLVLPSDFNVREFGWAKRYADRLPDAMDEGLEGLDAELFLVLALVAMHRADKIETRDVPDVFERLSTAGPFIDTFWLEGAPKEEAEPDSPPPPSSGENGASSGLGSPKSSEISELTRPDSGTPASATSQSAPTTSAT